MAIVQLIDLSLKSEKLSWFSYFKDVHTPLLGMCSSVSGTDGLQSFMRENGLQNEKNWGASTPKSAWPTGSNLVQNWNPGYPVKIALVIAWGAAGVAESKFQPEENLWVLHPATGSVVSVSSNLEVLKEQVANFLGAQTIF
ncbi:MULTISPECIES: hypothetical protein [Xanthomonas]|uniref:hypothetical protein n=1 Tax=Xanthomonas TaxID=338 RepID=UPI001F28F60A|nr:MULTISPECIES: hypothetical protein [Xanthomonas]MCE4510794.1 hypothetical protein [Xanthomonas hortorum pv. vitians]MCE4518789.1 hypothetical protein [Xanthomonas hortorum pv. vitians]WDJ46391.1 hypothetical protein JH286_16280 [Xanthomonas campestris pv. campestris]